MLELSALRGALTRAVLSGLPSADADGPAELAQLYALARDYPERGGKQLRGLLVLLSAAAHGGDWRAALPVAAALELFQSWVLIHDDIEDDSEERRGRPALHKLTGIPIAINVGDLLHVHMWQVLNTGVAGHPLERALQAEVERMIRRTAEGQHLDLSWVRGGRFEVSEADYLTMVTLKTAYYTVISPLRLGALCAGTQPDERFEAAGLELGAAFQIRDDVLNLAPGRGYGKEFAGDLYEAKRTLILVETFRRASAEERADLAARLGKPRAERREEDVRYALELIARCGALAYAQRVAEAKAEHGLERLREALAELPEQLIARELAGLLESLARRHA